MMHRVQVLLCFSLRRYNKESIKRQLRKSGLIVYEETVRIQHYVLGVVPGDIHEHAFVRIGAPLYRLQQVGRCRLTISNPS